MKKTLILFFITLLLVGCATITQAPGTSKGPLDTQQAPGVNPTKVSPIPTPDQSQPVIILEKSGGIAGVDMKWTVFADGRVVSTGQTGSTMEPDQVISTLADIQKLGFFGLDADYSSVSVCDDCFIYKLTVNSGGQSKTVVGVEGDPNTPAVFSQIIEKITSLITP